MRRSALLLLPMLAACASASSPQPAGTPSLGPAPAAAATATVLAVAITAPTSAAYEAADTAQIRMQAGGQDVRVDVASLATAQLDLAPTNNGIRGTVRVTDVQGSATNTMGPTISVTAGDLPGAAQIAVAPNGEVTVVQRPDFSQNLRRILSPTDFYRRFFMRLPGRAVQRGATWTDTVTITEDNMGLQSETQSIITSTWERDTTVGGRTLNVISSRISSTARVTGTTDGVEIAQTLSGQSTALTLWDPARRLIFERHEDATASGTTDLPAMGISDLPTSATAKRSLRLKS